MWRGGASAVRTPRLCPPQKMTRIDCPRRGRSMRRFFAGGGGAGLEDAGLVVVGDVVAEGVGRGGDILRGNAFYRAQNKEICRIFSKNLVSRKVCANFAS